ncbi:MAG: hypothetical protein M1823_003407 [Watsoniomyces obsoletus]|nr:MAG: hypothetical protein M1823_003407 [Watsoniomyces obsoletus]
MDHSPRALQRIQAFEDGSQLLERQHRAQRYRPSSNPPPYSQVVSSTDRPAPHARLSRPTIVSQSEPWCQFQHQAIEEYHRLIHQSLPRTQQRRQTLPFDRGLDFAKNAENNIRSDWIKQGIWKEEWGPAWPKDTVLSPPAASHLSTPRPWPLGRWGHEMPPLRTRSNIFGGATMKVNVEASRPCRQFGYQMIKEAKWLMDEEQCKGLSADEIEAKAYLNVRNTWKMWGIWMEEWGLVPCMEWPYSDRNPISSIFGPYSFHDTVMAEAARHVVNLQQQQLGQQPGPQLQPGHRNLFGIGTGPQEDTTSGLQADTRGEEPSGEEEDGGMT